MNLRLSSRPTTLVTLCAALSALAQEQTLSIQEAELHIANQQAREFRIALRPTPDAKVYLAFDARTDRAVFRGGSPGVRIDVDGQVVRWHALVDRPLNVAYLDGSVRCVFGCGWLRGRPRIGTTWKTIYGPSFESDRSKLGPEQTPVDERIDPFAFVLDVTDLVQPGENVVRFTNCVGPNAERSIGRPLPIVLRNVRLMQGHVPRYESPAAAAAREAMRFVEPRSEWDVAYDVKVEEGGAFTVVAGRARRTFVSKFSHPGGSWRELTAEKSDSGWTSLTVSRQGHAIAITGDSPAYRLVRTLRLLEGRIDIDDRITNRRDRLTGVGFDNFTSAAPDAIDRSYLCGVPVPIKKGRRSEPMNPTAAFTDRAGGVGLVAKDDVFRATGQCYLEEGVMGIRCRGIGLEPGASYAVEWSVYPLAEREGYYDFVNRIRRDWRVNTITLPGPYCATVIAWMEGLDVQELMGRPRELVRTVTPEQRVERQERIRELIAKWHPGYVTATGSRRWFFDIRLKDDPAYVPHGTSFSRELPAAHIYFRDILADVNAACPNALTSVYFCAWLSAERGAREKYRDSLYMDRKGRPMTYSSHYPMFLPTLENSYGRALLEYPGIVLDKVGAEVFYWDVFGQHGSEWHSGNGQWDGRSVVLDPRTGDVVTKLCVVPLYTQPFVVKMIEEIKRRGGKLLTNGQPMTKTVMALMRSFGAVSFVETGSGPSNCARTHLYTPMALGNRVVARTEADAYRQIRELLEWGCFYGYYSPTSRFTFAENPVGSMYPIVPQELHAGYAIGRDKIVTTVSGRFGFGDASLMAVDHFGPDGRATGKTFGLVKREGKTYVELALEPEEMAVVRRE